MCLEPEPEEVEFVEAGLLYDFDDERDPEPPASVNWPDFFPEE